MCRNALERMEGDELLDLHADEQRGREMEDDRVDDEEDEHHAVKEVWRGSEK
jgi:hypothetical protein